MKKYLLGGAVASALLLGSSVLAAGPVTCTMSVSPSVIQVGVPTPVTVTWNTTGADYNGIVAPFLGGSRPPSGSRTFVVSTSQFYQLVALSGTPLINGTGTYANCIARVSAVSYTAP